MTDRTPKPANQGQAKTHTISRPNPNDPTAPPETRDVTQEEWRTNGKQLKSEGWTRDDEDETEPPVA